jgi:hypothetical protein
MQMNYQDKYQNQTSDNRRYGKSQKITKEQFLPNTYPKELMYSMMNEFGSIIKNKQYKKSEANKIRTSIKRARRLGFFPFCSAHYFKMK